MKLFKGYKEYISGAADHVPLLRLVYIINFPLVKLFLYYKVQPNTITTLSLISATLSYYFLFNNLYLFIAFWTFALFFDVCDGMVARATKNYSLNGSFYDHYSDIVKILFLFLFVALKYNVTAIWVLTMLTTIVFSLMAIANMLLEQKNISLRYEAESIKMEDAPLVSKQKIGLIKQIINKFPPLKQTILFFYSSIFIIYGNFYLLLLPLGINETLATYTLILVLIVVFKAMYHMIRAVYKKNKFMQAQNIKWK